MIEGKNAPVSMGVIPAGQITHMAVTPAVEQKLAQGAVLAVSVEPVGGSPTGQPTGPVVAAGDLKGI
ncbi:anti-sigma factor, partial [Mesorhizobium sp. M4B.F.Ca.ET.088.02.2.1]